MDPVKEAQGIIDIIKGRLTKEDFTVAVKALFKVITDIEESLIRKIEKLLAQATDSLRYDISEAKTEMEGECETMMEDTKKKSDTLFEDVRQALNFVYDKARSLKPPKDGDDGHTPTTEELTALILPLIPEDVEETPAETRDKLESLEGDERLDASAIKNLPETVRESVRLVGGTNGIQLYVDGVKKGIVKYINLIPGTGIAITHNPTNGRNDITFSATGSASLSPITVTGLVNDSNVSFTAASAPNVVIVNGAAYRNGHGCTIVGTAITLNAPVGLGGDIYCL